MQESHQVMNREYIDQLYELFLKDAQAVSAEWREYFQLLALEKDKNININKIDNKSDINIAYERKQALVKELIYAYRDLGHLHANLDPLGLTIKPQVSELEIAFYDFTADDMEKEFVPDHFGDGKPIKLKDLIETLQTIYCHTIGAEYLYINNQEEVRWIENRFENPLYRQAVSIENQKRILDCLTAAEGLEKYLGAKYVGQKRFSLEGSDSLIVLLDALIQTAGSNQINEIVMGMAHRGRLNVLINILGKSPQELFDEFEGKHHDEAYSGDVKYHLGFSSDIQTQEGIMHLALAFNPSHLEIVSAVATGSVYARQQRRGLERRQEVLGVQIHGDAAFAGQGVVMETFAFSQTTGYGTAGTIHIIVNNQVGFTTNPMDSRSTYYCTDIAKMVQAPIFHVNADDPEAVLFVAQLAIDYRQMFGKDIVIDLVCYRRHGHNEADEPSATQPMMYQKIRHHPSARKLYADKLIQSQKITQQEADESIEAYRNALDKAENFLVPLVKEKISHSFGVDWTPYMKGNLSEKVNTGMDLKALKKLATQLNTLPAGMILQPQVAKIIQDNLKMAQGEIPVNWGFAENLAYAALLSEGIDIRISGQDCQRATFAHRHAVLHDYHNGNIYIPLEHISKSAFRVVDSILSEVGVLAFEYGYSTAMPNTLTLWEAQFGDFANGAQVVIDQFISSGEQKWKRLCGLTLLLPHGYEGMGPEHSSARLERYLQLCAQENMQVCVPSTPAQMFHLLRQQMLRKARKPLVVMTPKSLLRHKLAVSSLTELSEGEFQPILSESEQEGLKPDDIVKIIFCSGKIYYELIENRRANHLQDVAIIRIEQIYPFLSENIKKILKKYKKSKNIIWCQEEPQNQGAWFFVKSELEACLNASQDLQYSGRRPAAAPAVGSSKLHLKEQQDIIKHALGLSD